jgi:hypothetical protein
MCVPFFLVVWGTKIRARRLGDRADYCPGCLQVSRFTVQTVEESKHIYLVPLGYRERERLKQCALCGTIVRGRSDEPYLTDPQLPLRTLLGATNPGLTAERVAEIEARSERERDPQSRRDKSLVCFLRRQTDELRHAFGKVDFPTAAIGIALALVCFATFFYAGPIWAASASVVSVWLGGRFHRSMSHHRAAQVILPRVLRFLAAQGIPFAEFEAGVRGKSPRDRRLLRHFARGPYDGLRMQPEAPQREELFHVPEGVKSGSGDGGTPCPSQRRPAISRLASGDGTPAPRGNWSVAPTPHRALAIVVCSACGTRVMATQDGTCPACRNPIPSATSADTSPEERVVIKPGGIYSCHSGGGDYSVVKVLVVEDGAVHVKLHKNRFTQRPGTIDPRELQVAVGFVPLSEAGFRDWDPTLLLEQEVIEAELVGYRLWRAR